MSNSKSQKYLFNQNESTIVTHFKRKKSQNPIKDEKSIFDRLFNENLEKKFKMDALREHHLSMQTVNKSPKGHRKNQSSIKDRSKSQRDFYNKQMKLKGIFISNYKNLISVHHNQYLFRLKKSLTLQLNLIFIIKKAYISSSSIKPIFCEFTITYKIIGC